MNESQEAAGALRERGSEQTRTAFVRHFLYRNRRAVSAGYSCRQVCRFGLGCPGSYQMTALIFSEREEEESSTEVR